MKKSVSCIIPFLNEGGRIGKVVKEIIKVRNINQIICIDGGSNDEGYKEVEAFYPKVEPVRLSKNIGKSGTVEIALKKTKGDYILLFDADLEKVDFLGIETVIDRMMADEKIDMIIFNRQTPRLITKLNRMELLFSGERIMKTTDLKEILKFHPTGFQLETAINTFMIEKKKSVFYFDSTNVNLPKLKKFGSFKGIGEDIKMFWEVFKFNPLSYIYQLLFFARKKL